MHEDDLLLIVYQPIAFNRLKQIATDVRYHWPLTDKPRDAPRSTLTLTMRTGVQQRYRQRRVLRPR